MFTIREFTDVDAPAVVAVRSAAAPHLVNSAEGLRWDLRNAAPARRLRRVVAEAEDGGRTRIAGAADAGTLPGTGGAGHLTVAVDPRYGGLGIGSALLDAAEEHLVATGVTLVHTWVDDDAPAAGFAARRGYSPGRTGRFLCLDLAAAPPLSPLPDRLPRGVEVRTVAEFGSDLRELWQADLECADDEPGDIEAGHLAYEPWLGLNWRRPDWRPELSAVVVADGGIASYSVAQTDGRERCWSAMTGTRRAHRGRGFAGLAKLHVLHLARRAGVTRFYTGNDASNAPMLAVNARLGYRTCRTERRHTRRLR